MVNTLAGFYPALLCFGLLLACVALGLFIRPRLPEHHRDQHTLESVRLAITMLVTFVALVLGLLTASAKAHFDDVSDDYRAFAADIIQLDQLLAYYGPATDEARVSLRVYTMGVIIGTWPQEAPPTGLTLPAALMQNFQPGRAEDRSLGAILTQIETILRTLQPQNDYQKQIMTDGLAQFRRLIQQRWRIIESAHATISPAFLIVMMVWLCIIYFCFGLCAKPNATVVIVATVCAFSTASSLFVVIDMDSPIDGAIIVSSQPLRDALADLQQ